MSDYASDMWWAAARVFASAVIAAMLLAMAVPSAPQIASLPTTIAFVVLIATFAVVVTVVCHLLAVLNAHTRGELFARLIDDSVCSMLIGGSAYAFTSIDDVVNGKVDLAVCFASAVMFAIAYTIPSVLIGCACVVWKWIPTQSEFCPGLECWL